jgi:hypothetical protein
MLRYMAGVRWQDIVISGEMASRCGVEQLDVELRRRLRWFGHVARTEEGSVLRLADELQVRGRRPPGRPRKTWRMCVQEDMDRLSIWRSGEDSPDHPTP